jgi:Acyltransferase
VNIQPYDTPQQHWPPKLKLWWFHCAKIWRRRALAKQKITEIQLEGLEHLAESLGSGKGVLLTPNHSFHYDSYCLLEASDKLSKPFYFMTAWQVFFLSNWFDRMSMQWCGCFSVDREGTDMQAIKTAVDVMQNRPHPLVIFPEGDVYHTNDRVTPFRDGAAAMALMAARKAERPVVIIPVAIKRWYNESPEHSLKNSVQQLEQRLFWRPKSDADLVARVLSIAEGLLSLKELEHLGSAQSGSIAERIGRLAITVLEKAEDGNGITKRVGLIPERVKEVRRCIIQSRTAAGDNATTEQRKTWSSDMDDMFLVTQLYSYPGDYLTQEPSVERLAETIDKLEEDALGAVYPSVHGSRRAVVRFDKPIELPVGKEKKMSASELTSEMHSRVQAMLDDLNRNK